MENKRTGKDNKKKLEAYERKRGKFPELENGQEISRIIDV